MASQLQSKYIADLAVIKTKEFKEVKELILSSGIVSENAELVRNAETIAEITNYITDAQASKLIDALIALKEPKRSNIYSNKRITQVTGELDHIKEIIKGWDFPA